MENQGSNPGPPGKMATETERACGETIDTTVGGNQLFDFHDHPVNVNR